MRFEKVLLRDDKVLLRFEKVLLRDNYVLLRFETLENYVERQAMAFLSQTLPISSTNVTRLISCRVDTP